MRYRIISQINDGMMGDTGFDVDVNSVDDLLEDVAENLCNDEGIPFGPGATVLIERLT